MEFRTLANGNIMPSLGLGTWKNDDDTANVIKSALDMGYCHIDGAAAYHNEKEVGEGIELSKVDRQDIFVTTKVWNTNQGYDETLKAFEKSLEDLKLQYVDLYLVHWPIFPTSKETWKALERLNKEGLAKAIGVANFQIHHLEELMKTAEILPMVNQVEFHPRLIQNDLLSFCKSHGIVHTGWAPLMQGNIFEIPLLKAIGEKYGKTVSQIALRWSIQMGVIPIPKTVHCDYLDENLNIFDFLISDEDMKIINTLDDHHRFGPDPDNFNF